MGLRKQQGSEGPQAPQPVWPKSQHRALASVKGEHQQPCEHQKQRVLWQEFHVPWLTSATEIKHMKKQLTKQKKAFSVLESPQSTENFSSLAPQRAVLKVTNN